MKVLLIADVGSNTVGFYHVGDEAMLYQTIQWYQSHYPEIKLGVVSRSASHGHLPVTESLHLPFPKADIWLASPWYCFHLIVRVVLADIVGLPVLGKMERAFIATVSEYDCWHFSGGGNIYSHHAPWLYYVFFLLFLGKWRRKKIWLTSQTIGPFTWFDGWLARFFLQLGDVLIVRGYSNPFLLKAGVGLDAAYDLKTLSKSVLPKKSSQVLRIGLSLHDWKNFGEQLQKVVAAALIQLAQTQKIELVILPHVFTRDMTEWDRGYMKIVAQKLPKTIKVITFSYSAIVETEEPSSFIKTVTAELDLMIATRYHALVFALSSNVPVLTFQLDDYYVQKNSQLLALVYQKDWQRFVVSFGVHTALELVQKLQTLQQQLPQEKALLKKCNQRLKQDKQLQHFETLISTAHA